MENRKIGLVIGAALFVGLMMGILIPNFFGSGEAPSRRSSPAEEPAPGASSGPDYTLKISELKRQLQVNPGNVGLWIQLGNTYFDSNRYQESIEAYLKALELKPNNPDVLTDLGVMYRRSGQPEKAVDCFKKAALVSPTHLQCRMNLGIVLFFDLQDPEGARKAMEDLIRVAGDSPEADNAKAFLKQIEADSGGR